MISSFEKPAYSLANVLCISVTLLFSLCRSFTVPKVFWRKTGDIYVAHCSHRKMRTPFLTCLVPVRLSPRPSRSIYFGDVSGAHFSKSRGTFRARKATAKPLTLRSQTCFIHTFLIWTEVPFIQEVLGAYTAPVLDKDELKMALWAR